MAEPPAPAGRLHRALRWCFVSRRTGEITVVQFPNPALWAWVAGTLASRVVARHGTAHDLVFLAAQCVLGLWALDEMARGVNPFRRVLGLAVGTALAVGLVTRS